MKNFIRGIKRLVHPDIDSSTPAPIQDMAAARPADPRSDPHIYDREGILPLYSNNRNDTLAGLFFKPEVAPFTVHACVAEQVKRVDENSASQQTGLFYENKDLFVHDFGHYADKDPYPLPYTSDREGYDGENHIQYWCHGLVQFMSIMGVFSQLAPSVESRPTYFELGCASGRFLRHALLQAPNPMNVIGCDTNTRHIDWVRHFLPDSMRIFQNTSLPSLPLEDNSCDIVVGSSVFTHIDNLEFAWLMELRRIMKPGAVAFLSIMSDNTWSKLANDPAYGWAFDALIQNKYTLPYQWNRDNFPEAMPEKRVVLYHTYSPIYNCDVYHHTEYIRREWGRFFQIADILPGFLVHQDMVVLKKHDK